MREGVDRALPLLRAEQRRRAETGGRDIPVAGAALQIIGIAHPVDHLHVGIDAGLLELLGQHQNGVAHIRIVGIGLQDELFAVISGLFQNLLGLGRILAIVEFRGHVTGVIGAWRVKQRGIPLRQDPGRGEDVVDIDDLADRLPDQRIGGQAVTGMQHEILLAIGKSLQGRQLRYAVEPLGEIEREVGDDVGLLGLQGGEPRIGFGNEIVADGIQIRGLLAGEAVSILGRLVRRVVLVAQQHQMAVLLPIAELERAGSNDLDLARRLVLLACRKHDQRIGRALEQIDEDGVGALEMDDERIWIRRFVFVDVGQQGGVGRDFLEPLERRQHVGRRHFLAVAELDALAQCECEGFGLVAGFDLRGEHRARIVVLVHRHQGLEDLVDDLELDQAAGHVGIERGGACDGGIDQRPAFGLRQRRGGDEQRRDSNNGQEEGSGNPRQHRLASV